MKKIIVLLFIPLLLSCEPRPIKEVEYEYRKTALIAKTERLIKGNTTYTFVFGEYEQCNVSYSVYVRYEIGDSIPWERIKNNTNPSFFTSRWTIVQ